MKKEFIQFLREHKAIKAFTEELLKQSYYPTLDEYLDSFEYEAADAYILSAFNWPDDDVDYWLNMNEKWIKIVNNKKEKA